jgi:hypothetical protein
LPAFSNRVAFEITRSIRVFLGLEVGITRNGRQESGALRTGEPEPTGLRAQLSAVGGEADGADPGNIVWIFGSGRSGSTWLSSMMAEMEDQTVWNEPLVGALFGDLYYTRGGDRIGTRGKHFILGGGYRESWLGPMRALVLGGAAARFPDAVQEGYLIIKEPNGSVGAPLLMETLPESRMVLLVRDPRDVVASSMDAQRKGGWAAGSGSNLLEKRYTLAEARPDAYVKLRADMYLQSVGKAREAYEAHAGYKTLVRYEDLRAETLSAMRRIYVELGIEVDEGELARAVQKHSWEEIPEEKKGEGKFHRKATPGGWKEDLTPRQVEIVERVTAPLLEEFYPEGTL